MDCYSIIPDVNYGAFSKRLQKSVVKNRIPVGGSIDLTSRCNLKCVHCYLDKPSSEEMSTDELHRILDEIAEAGCLWILLTGGEPLLRKDFKDIYQYAKKKGFLINVFTNATLIDEDIADMFHDSAPFAVEVSVYGHTAETYEKVTGVKGSFEKCMRGIGLLRERKIPLRLKSVIMTINQHELNDLIKFAEDLSLEFRYDTNIHSRLDGSHDPCEYRLDPEDVIALDYQDKRRIKALRELVDYSSKQKMDQEDLFHCGAGLTSFHIGSDGKLYVCMMYRKESFDLRQGSFSEAWEAFIPQVRFQKAPGVYNCGSCEHYFLCGHCPGWGLVENNDVLKATKFLCKLAHMRAEVFSDEPLWRDKSAKFGIDKETETG